MRTIENLTGCSWLPLLRSTRTLWQCAAKV